MHLTAQRRQLLLLLIALPASAAALVACTEKPQVEPAAPVVHSRPAPHLSPTRSPLEHTTPLDDPCAALSDVHLEADCLLGLLDPGPADLGSALGSDSVPDPDPTAVPDLGPDHTPGYWDDVCAGGAVCNPSLGGLPAFTPGGGLSFAP